MEWWQELQSELLGLSVSQPEVLEAWGPVFQDGDTPLLLTLVSARMRPALRWQAYRAWREAMRQVDGA